MLGSLSMSFALAALAPESRSAREVFVVPLARDADWRDFAFLAAVAASSAVDGGEPLVLSVGANGELDPSQRDFLKRLGPSRALWIGGEPAGPQTTESESIAGDDLDQVACALAERCFAAPVARAVVVAESDYDSALAAAPLAARLHAPLVFAREHGLSPRAEGLISKLGVRSIVLVGRALEHGELGTQRPVERLRDATELARWEKHHGLEVGYLALVAPADRDSGFARKLSLAGAALAAGRGGCALPVRAREAAEIRAAMIRWRADAGVAPEELCIAANPDAIAMPTVPSGEGIDTDPPSDLEYAQLDADPFVELAVGRFVAESTDAATLLAARSLAYDELAARAPARSLAIAEWERECAPVFANYGFGGPLEHDGGHPFDADSPLAEAAVLMHASHASWLQLGDTYAADSRVLLAPCFVGTSGCSPAALDEDENHRSVALRLLANGAVAFVGNARRAVAQQELYASEFWNAVLAGDSIGRANRAAQNRVIAELLDRGELAHGVDRYELYNQRVYGDPALKLSVPSKPKIAPAQTIVQGSTVSVRAPSAWWSAPMHAPSDWGYTESQEIRTLRGAGVGVECSWDAEHHRNRDLLIYTVAARTTRRVAKVELAGPAPAAPLGWDGKWFVDEHADGSRTLYWRVQLVDFAMPSGAVQAKLERLDFRLE